VADGAGARFELERDAALPSTGELLLMAAIARDVGRDGWSRSGLSALAKAAVRQRRQVYRDLDVLLWRGWVERAADRGVRGPNGTVALRITALGAERRGRWARELFGA
jgi:hypothetical protein